MAQQRRSQRVARTNLSQEKLRKPEVLFEHKRNSIAPWKAILMFIKIYAGNPLTLGVGGIPAGLDTTLV
jgi:hypothetical protein